MTTVPEANNDTSAADSQVRFSGENPPSNISSIDSSNDPTKQTLYYKAGHFLWGHDPVNTLNHTYFVTPKTHAILRNVFMVFQVIVWIWAAIAIEKFYYMFAYMTLWGFTMVTVYFIFVNVVKHSHHSKKRWKAIYLLGEVAATLEFLICPFFWAFLFPEMISKGISLDSLVLQTSLHLICSIFIWVEVFLSSIAFPKCHLVILLLVAIAYLPVNYVYSIYIMGKPVYPVMTWQDYKTIIYLAVALVMGVAGFFFGSYQHKKKKDRPFRKSKKGNEDVTTRLI